MILVQTFVGLFRAIANPPQVPAAVERNLTVAAKAQEIAEGLKYGEPAVNLEVLVAAAKLLDLPVRPIYSRDCSTS